MLWIGKILKKIFFERCNTLNMEVLLWVLERNFSKNKVTFEFREKWLKIPKKRDKRYINIQNIWRHNILLACTVNFWLNQKNIFKEGITGIWISCLIVQMPKKCKLKISFNYLTLQIFRICHLIYEDIVKLKFSKLTKIFNLDYPIHRDYIKYNIYIKFINLFPLMKILGCNYVCV